MNKENVYLAQFNLNREPDADGKLCFRTVAYLTPTILKMFKLESKVHNPARLKDANYALPIRTKSCGINSEFYDVILEKVLFDDDINEYVGHVHVTVNMNVDHALLGITKPHSEVVLMLTANREPDNGEYFLQCLPLTAEQLKAAGSVIKYHITEAPAGPDLIFMEDVKDSYTAPMVKVKTCRQAVVFNTPAYKFNLAGEDEGAEYLPFGKTITFDAVLMNVGRMRVNNSVSAIGLDYRNLKELIPGTVLNKLTEQYHGVPHEEVAVQASNVRLAEDGKLMATIEVTAIADDTLEMGVNYMPILVGKADELRSTNGTGVVCSVYSDITRVDLMRVDQHVDSRNEFLTIDVLAEDKETMATELALGIPRTATDENYALKA